MQPSFDNWDKPDSDVAGFSQDCIAAATNDDAFEYFRRLPGIKQAVERPVDRGKIAWLAASYNDWLLSQYNTVRVLDVFGKPDTCRMFGKTGRGTIVSPAAAAYAEDLAILDECFSLNGNSEIIDIIEIGGGFGGMAALMAMMTTFDSYVIYDAPEPRMLQTRYLKAMEVAEHISHATVLEPTSSDLLISVAALSELDSEAHDAYGKALLAHADRGYLFWAWADKDMTIPENIGDAKAFIESFTGCDIMAIDEVAPGIPWRYPYCRFVWGPELR